MYGDNQPGLSARCCVGSAFDSSNTYADYYNVWEITEVDASLAPKSYADNCAANPQPDVEADPAASPPPAVEVTDPTEPV